MQPDVKPRSRLVLDVSSLAHWAGVGAGIMRAEAALAEAAMRRDGAILAVWDARLKGFRRLAPRWASLLVGPLGAIGGGDAGAPRTGWRRLVPSRLPMLMALERMRLTAGSRLGAGLAALLQRAIFALKPHDLPLHDSRGRRLSYVPVEEALAKEVGLGSGDVVLSAGAPWWRIGADDLEALQRRAGFRYASLCYDLIPIMLPEVYPAEARADFERHWRTVFRFADLLVVNAERIAEDAAAYGRSLGAAPRIAVAPLGAPDSAPERAGPLSEGLVAGRFALYVSTIEPRKNHGMLLRVWRRLLDRGLPQRHNFGLVLVGRAGWMVDEVVAGLAAPPPLCRHIPQPGDEELSALYRACAFTLYPSLYEGFGLPLLESFRYGKAVISSSGGALPETAAGRAPCLDPSDETAWEETLAAWIESPAARAPYEARIRSAPPDPTWPEAASRILDLVTACPQAGSAGEPNSASTRSVKAATE